MTFAKALENCYIAVPQEIARGWRIAKRFEAADEGLRGSLAFSQALPVA